MIGVGAERPLHLTVIAKQPVEGQVKTRLTPPLSPADATALAAAALEDTFAAIARTAAQLGARPVVLAAGELHAEVGEMAGWLPAGFDVVPQRGDGLAERLANGFADLGPGVIIGMDTPGALHHLGWMLRSLSSGVDSLGLTVDGGYWAIALHRVDAAVFDGVPMSTGRTGIAQVRRLHSLGRPVRLAPMVHDFDRAEDLAAAAREAPGSNFAAALETVSW